MIVSFFGHASFSESSIDMQTVLNVLEKELQGQDVDFYVGNYGDFDSFSLRVARAYQQLHANSSVVFVMPYLNNVRCNDFAKKCDCSIYPEIEKVPLKFAIIERNKWVVQNSDLLIFYYKTIGKTRDIYEYAISKNKRVINLAEQFS
ncbi:MAG: hypothetical protein IKA61_00325 [Clostridia bacterium]|nr:hypothetical protein [Clostridia bacterium]